jgi:hypothetical protein
MSDVLECSQAYGVDFQQNVFFMEQNCDRNQVLIKLAANFKI